MNMPDLPVYILSLDKRKDLWTELIEQAKQCIGPNVYSFIVGDGELLPRHNYDKINWCQGNNDIINKHWGYGKTETKLGHFNAHVSHKMMINRAIQNGWDRFLLLEDDAYFTDRFSEIWNQVPTSLIEDSDLLYLGFWHGEENDAWNQEVEYVWDHWRHYRYAKLSQIGGMHGVIINSTVYDLLLSLPLVNPIDYQLNQYKIHDKIKSRVILPKSIHIRTTYSYLEQSVIERNHI